MKAKNKFNNQLYYFFDREADVFYLSQGKPSARDIIIEKGDNILLRTEAKTGKVRGFTILNMSKRQSGKPSPIMLPVQASWLPA